MRAMKSKTTRGATRGAKKVTSSVAPGAGLCVAAVARWDAEGVTVTLPQGGEAVAARVMLPPGVSAGEASVAVGQAVVVMLDASGPVVLGLLQPIGAAAPAEKRGPEKRVEIVAAEEIVLKCGEASLVLRANGRAALRGATVETRAKGLNRIKGGTVSIN